MPDLPDRSPELHGAQFLPKGEALVKRILARWGKEWSRWGEMADQKGVYAYKGIIVGTLFRYLLKSSGAPFHRKTYPKEGTSTGLNILQECSNNSLMLLEYFDSKFQVRLYKLADIKADSVVTHRYGQPYYDYPLNIGILFESHLRELFGPPLDEIG